MLRCLCERGGGKSYHDIEKRPMEEIKSPQTKKFLDKETTGYTVSGIGGGGKDIS